ncbi:Subtilisin-like protease [Melia azedarach]|uniref:Subtilisin-like protease n=1 Tax=Melia azedarach TaxID=155640 RepID=A0ACC1YRZ7_MELAZ|nr:Subtilisin-like protease [Melia azedarach]
MLQSYVVYLGGHSHGQNPTSDDIDRARNYHHELLGSCLGSTEEAKGSIIHSYGRFVNGFSAVLEEEHAQSLAKHPEVVSVFKDEGVQLHTTRSWDFLGLEKDSVIPLNSAWNKARFGEDVIIGNIDSGVWPESKSFSDEGIGPVPQKWKGICQDDTRHRFKCNRKLIGVRYISNGLIEDLRSKNPSFVVPLNLTDPRDHQGHGTHTLSTAGGNFVSNVSVYGNGFGTAKGGSPKARVAAYKVCWKPHVNDTCNSGDILAGFDLAIHDGVDVISVSMGSSTKDYFENSVAIGSFHAMMNGIIVVASAGNSGPRLSSAANTAPWLFTIGASTIDRDFMSYVTLGNKMVIKGESIAPKGALTQDLYPLITGGDAKVATASHEDATRCKNGAVDPNRVKGKILVCNSGNHGQEKGQQAAQAGAVGMILANSERDGNEILLPGPNFLPSAHMNYKDGQSVYAYINSTKDPVASITNAVTEFNKRPSQMMGFFSSRGPNNLDPAILKPDVTAPGVDIIAAYTEAIGPTGAFDDRRIPYNIFSGTSMSCPHVSGIVGLVKTAHPDWSPAAIKSAIMTSSTTRDASMRPILDESTGLNANPFAYGAGHVSPDRALDPGLVYELGFDDYLNYICSCGYNQATTDKFTAPKKFSCPKTFSIADFNYPSIAIPNLNGSFYVTRRVKNVGPPNSSYKATIVEIEGVSALVEPSSLSFTKYGEEKTFKVTFTPNPNGNISKPTDYVFGELIWADGLHHVSSSIAVKVL